ncbi:UNVERIFIED_ORG: hypothetical protein ABIC62_001860 [Burkholderia sp. 1595]|uniref:PIN domain-containing protein n=1 Tax=Paraburkholderia terricola TaxID=169427 RepID=A0ABU1LPI0_9BURK|nr:hypothetical protein [Paraburkholderia terricola]MDR6408470.1 hypothetical protein [Paraburkholderia terricola]
MVFDDSNVRHSDFSAIKKWIDDRLGIVVYGGTKYKQELSLTTRYMKLLRLMQDAGKAALINDQAVDKLEVVVNKKTEGTECDDQHIIALLAAARCPLLCSTDARSFGYIKDRSLYPKGSPDVRIYTSAKNKNLLKKSSAGTLKNVEFCVAR